MKLISVIPYRKVLKFRVLNKDFLFERDSDLVPLHTLVLILVLSLVLDLVFLNKGTKERD